MRPTFARSVSPIIAAAMTTAAIGAAVLVAAGPASASATTGNLIKNPGAEGSAPGSGPAAHWTTTNGNGARVAKYGTSGFPGVKSPGPASRGKNFFFGGNADPSNPTSSVAVQVVPLPASLVSKIDSGHESFQISGFFGGLAAQADNAGMEVFFRDAGGNFNGGDTSIGFVTPAQRHNKTGLVSRAAAAAVPAGSRSAYVQLIFDPSVGGVNDGYADNVGLSLTSH